ncbi:hypothetical protein B5X24_HaOG216418 [Helicoverpa armigera]|nr:hypothetical protein B5X24_HaOG216418 [Helicoverpa armigera]
MDSHLIFLLLYSVCVFGNPCLNRQKSAFPHDTDCDKYIYCKRGVPTVGQCPQGQVFDVVENKCLPKNIGKCVLGNSPTPNNIKKRAAEETSQIDIRRRKLALPECHEKSTWIEGDPENCRLFYLCVIGEISRVDCPYDFVFDPSKKFCVPPTHYNCITSTTTTSTSTTTTPKITPTTTKTMTTTEELLPPCGYSDDWELPDPASCTQYYKCLNGQVITVHCDGYNEFSPTKLECLPSSEAGCVAKGPALGSRMKSLVNFLKKPINLPNCGTDDVWLLPDPRDCSSYYYCISGQIDSVSCCCGYEFSPEQLVCLPKEQARCRTSYFPECQEYDVWSLPNPSSCTNFYWCNKGQVIKVNCPYLNEFSPTELECLPKDQAGCSITPTTRHPDIPSTIPSCGFYDYWVQGDPSDCSKYLICSQGKIEKYECCCDYEFSPIQMECLPKEIAGCSPTTTPPVTRTTVVSTTVATTTVDPDSTCTNTSLWVHPHPENCQLYLICFYGDLNIEKCGETTLFDPVSMDF